ncbi:unnamed protein product [Parnassius apollo]|uniref:(apollo) hypothetical protein n=1 Tax=Parnassius apollo TaxID=110799 RepID=A0A8S3XGZ3_PARAO|nr:unnamed protein product [Parnassius apollo]
MHRLFAELEQTEFGISCAFDVAELERLRREAVPSSDENAKAEDAASQIAEQPANMEAAVNTPFVVDSNDGVTVAQELELEHMRSSSSRRGVCGNGQYAFRKLTATSPHSPKQAESSCHEGSEPNAGDLVGSQPVPLRDELNYFWRRTGSMPYNRRQTFHGWTR